MHGFGQNVRIQKLSSFYFFAPVYFKFTFWDKMMFKKTLLRIFRQLYYQIDFYTFFNFVKLKKKESIHIFLDNFVKPFIHRKTKKIFFLNIFN